ncbi:hypothetical protein GI482_07025 [Bacillus sp. N3536]|nr:hypothetical protein GI482_07025 [Bacillus sp. N3536]
MNLLECGKSTVTDLLHPSTRRIGVETLALFGIIHRVPYTWVIKNYVTYEWDNFNFIHLNDSNENNKNNNLKDKLIFSSERKICGEIISVQGQSLYLRIENRSNAIIVDLVNPDLRNEKSFLQILEQNDYQWVSFLYPSIIPNHYFKTFIGYKEKTIKDLLIENEFPFVRAVHEIQFYKK